MSRDTSDPRRYESGFGNALLSEAEPGAVPRGQNSPRIAPLGLYAEQLNGTVFVRRRHENLRTWLYRIRPSLGHGTFQPVGAGDLTNDFSAAVQSPNLLRWRPRPLPEVGDVDIVEGLSTLGGAGHPSDGAGFAVHVYAAGADMKDCCFHDADGDLLLVPEHGRLTLQTELGWLDVAPGEVAIVPRAIHWRAELPDGAARGYVLEVFDGHFRLPERGPVGANGLADERHFLAPVAAYEDREVDYRIITKTGGQLWEATSDHSPFDVVGWHGSYAPFKYDLALFNAMGTVTFDHPDPSLLTVLTCPRADGSISAADFVVFAPRWDVAEHTFRPPFYHRNQATEVNGIIRGAVPSKGFELGCTFLTPPFSAHGLGPEGYEREIGRSGEAADRPHRLSDDVLWFQFESSYPMRVTQRALEAPELDGSYTAMFRGSRKHFSAP